MATRPRTPYESVAIPVGGGLNLADSPEHLAPGEASVLKNLLISGVGRLTARRAIVTLNPVTTGTFVGIFPFPWGDDADNADTGVVCLTHDSVGEEVLAYAAAPSGLSAALIGTVAGWGIVPTRPAPNAATNGQMLFVVDEGKEYGLTVYNPAVGTDKLWQPLFGFAGGAPAPIKARCVASYNNMLFVAGYGTETEPDRPEVVRFSYLGPTPGLEPPPGQVDVGDAAANDASRGLFDINDFFMVGERGVPVVAMGAAAGRLIVGTGRSTYALFGYDRDSFQLDQVSGQVGCVSTRSMCAADGIAYWWSQYGPARYMNGVVDTEFGRRLGRRLDQVVAGSVFTLHTPLTNEVRFFYSEAADQDAFKALCWNYRHQAWREEERDVAFFCAGGAEEGVGDIFGPSGDPSNLEHTEITETTLTAGWEPAVGLHPSTVTVLKLHAGQLLSDPVVQEAEVPFDTTAHEWSGLNKNAFHTTEVFHRRNGINSAAIDATDLTLVDALAKPKLGLGDFGFIPNENNSYVELFWKHGGEANMTAVLFRNTVNDFGSALEIHIPTTNTSFTDFMIGDQAGNTFYYWVRMQSTIDPAVVSEPSDVRTVTF